MSQAGTQARTVRPESARALSNTLVRVVKIMNAMKHQAPRQHAAVDASHYPLLFCVSAEPRRITAVAESIHSDVSTVSRQVSHLVQHGLLEKIVDPADGRAQLLSLSASGREVIDKLVLGRGKWFETVLATWSDEDVQTFEGYLTRFGDALEAFKAQGPATQPDTPTAPPAAPPASPTASPIGASNGASAPTTSTTPITARTQSTEDLSGARA